MTPELTDVKQSQAAPTPPWSPRFRAFAFLAVCVVAALVGGAAALLVVNLFGIASGPQQGEAERLFALCAALASLLSAPFCWWGILFRHPRLSPRRGAGAGVLTSLVAHPLTWLILLVTADLKVTTNLSDVIGLGNVHSIDLVLEAVFFISIVSLLVVGWLTALLGGLAGAAVVWALARLAEKVR